MQSRLVALGCGALLTLLMVTVPGMLLAVDLPAPVRLVLARIAPMMAAKEYSKVAAILEPALNASETRHAELAFALGNCRMLRGDRSGAIKAYDQAVSLDPGHAHAWLNQAKAAYETKQYREAGRCFAKGYGAEQGKHPENLYFSAAAYLMAGAHQEAIASFDRLFAAHPKSIKPEWREQFLHALMDDGQSKRALPLIRDLIARSAGEEKTRWQELLLSLYMRLNMTAEGATFARQLIDQQPDQPRWWKALAHIQLAANRHEDGLSALVGYSMLTRLSNQESRLLADLYLQAGIPAKAVPLYSRQLQDKADGQIAQRLVMAYHQMDQPAKALEVLARFRNLEREPRLLMLQGETCYTLKRYPEAAASYRRAASLNGTHQGQAWLMAGYAAMQAGDLETSSRALAQAIRFDKEKKAATLALSHINQQMVR
jgi:tetratricopeptide (TPR) repeat protein